MNGERKNKLLMTVEELKNELRYEEMACSKRELDISTIQNQTLVESRRNKHPETLISDQNRSVLSTQLSNLTWKITQADFILAHEKERHEKYFSMIAESRRKINQCTSSSEEVVAEDNEAKKSKEQVQALINEKDSLMENLTNLIKYNEEANNSMLNSKQIITILKKRNAALMLKLQKRLEEAEKEEKELMTRLRDI